jgi:hypothetical protein
MKSMPCFFISGASSMVMSPFSRQPDADPGVGGGELETFGLVDENDPVVLSKLRLEVEHHGDTAKTGAEHSK